MKYPIVLVAGLALAACTPDAPPIEDKPQVSQGVIGIDFASMPVGTQALYRNSNGERWAEVYRGKQGRFHVMQNVVDGEVTRTHYYLPDGTLHRREYADGNERTFSPRRCMRVLGECQFTSSDTKPRRSSQNQGVLLKSGAIYSYTFGPSDGSSQRTFKYKLGQFNLITSGRSGNYSETLIKVVTP